MSKCLVAQSGGPSSVINATVAGIVRANQLYPVYEKVLGGLNGVEGILQEKFVDLTELTEEENRVLCQTPGSALGSCRYRLKSEDYRRFFSILDKYDIETFFYVGGIDSMDTIHSLSDFAKQNGIRGKRFIGCPKTIDNDLVMTDHTPGFGSAAKFIATTALQCWLDVNAYTRQEVFILETMGRDAGWLAASAMLSGIVDVLILPEVDFDEQVFLNVVRHHIEEKNKCFIVVSEGAHYADGTYLSSSEAKNDGYGHAILGGAGLALKQMILASGVAGRVKVQELSTAQRCHASEQSLSDMTESYNLGMSALMRSVDISFSDRMVGIERKGEIFYEVEYVSYPLDKVVNRIRNVPQEWILQDYAGVSEEAIGYMSPLIEGEPDTIYENGLPAYFKPYYM